MPEGEERPLLSKEDDDTVDKQQEFVDLTSMALQVSLATFTRIALTSIDSAFLGHLGTQELAAASLAQVWTSVPLMGVVCASKCSFPPASGSSLTPSITVSLHKLPHYTMWAGLGRWKQGIDGYAHNAQEKGRPSVRLLQQVLLDNNTSPHRNLASIWTGRDVHPGSACLCLVLVRRRCPAGIPPNKASNHAHMRAT